MSDDAQQQSHTLMQTLVSPKFAEALSLIPPEWRLLDEDALVDIALGGWHKVQPLDLSLRRNFWVKYSVAVAEQIPITNESLYNGVCAEPTFYNLLKNPARIAFITTEPRTEKEKADHLLHLAWKRIRDILEATPGVNNKTGLKDAKLPELQTKIFQYLDQRQNGKLIERHQHHIKQETIQTNIDGGKLESHLTPQEVDKRLRELDEKLALPPAQAIPDILDTVSHNERAINTTARAVEERKRNG